MLGESVFALLNCCGGVFVNIVDDTGVTTQGIISGEACCRENGTYFVRVGGDVVNLLCSELDTIVDVLNLVSLLCDL